MARPRNSIARAGSSYDVTVNFYVNGVLFDPVSIVSVTLYDPNGNAVTTLTPTQFSTGVYKATWNVPNSIPAGVYTDTWVWKATVDTPTKTQSYSFRVNGGIPNTKKDCLTGPLFITNKEVNLFHSLNKELLQKVVAQKITYFSVSEEHTDSHRLYGEAIAKTVFQPVEVNALVLYEAPTQTNTKFSIDTTYSIEVYFYQEELRERLLVPREGDFVKFGNIAYEIERLTRPQIVYGQINNEVMVKAECRVARESQFNIINSEN